MQVIELDEYLQKIDKLTDNGKLEQAAFHCLYLLRQFPKMLRLYEKIGRIYSEMGHFSGALNIYLRLCAVQPENHFYHIPLVYTYAALKQPKKAIEHCQIALSLQPDNPFVTRELSLWMEKNNIHSMLQDDVSIDFSTGLQAFREKKYAEAITHFIKSSFYDLSSLFIGFSYYYLGSEEKGILILEEIIKKEPYNISALRILCAYYSALDPILFSHYINRLMDLDPTCNHWESLSNQVSSQHNAIPIIFYEWTGTPKTKSRVGWQQSNEKLIINDNRKLPEWLELLPIADNGGIVAENRVLEESFYHKTYFSEIYSHVSRASQLEEDIDVKATDSELEQAFILLKQVAADGYPAAQAAAESKPSDTSSQEPPVQAEISGGNGIIEEAEPTPQEREQMRSAWRCFCTDEQKKGIQLYKELIERNVCPGKIKKELQELSLLFPDDNELLNLLQSIQ